MRSSKRLDIQHVKLIMAGIGGFVIYPIWGIVPAFWVTLAGCFLYVYFRGE